MNKKFTLIVLAITVASSSLFAQSKGLFFTLNGGYSWSGMQKTAQELTFQPGTPPTDPATSSIVSMMNQNLSDTSGNRYKGYAYDGYGRGGVLNFSIGYMINPYVGVEMGLSYLLSLIHI